MPNLSATLAAVVSVKWWKSSKHRPGDELSG